jgi:hypothetical protein
LSIAVISGSLVIRGHGTPGSAYRIEFADSPAGGVWQLLGTATADSAGSFQLLDPISPRGRFYRAVYP